MRDSPATCHIRWATIACKWGLIPDGYLQYEPTWVACGVSVNGPVQSSGLMMDHGNSHSGWHPVISGIPNWWLYESPRIIQALLLQHSQSGRVSWGEALTVYTEENQIYWALAKQLPLVHVMEGTFTIQCRGFRKSFVNINGRKRGRTW